MDLGAMLYNWMDLFLISPFRFTGADSPIWGMWLGSALLAFYCTVVGEIIGAVLFLMHRKHYLGLEDKMTHHHNISVRALHAGDKETYRAVNRLANDDFGKTFFAQASIGLSTLLPVPFALGWMAQRFEGIVIYPSIKAGYVFILIISYIVVRILFSRVKKHLPLFRHVHEIKKEAKEKRGALKSFFNPEVAQNPEEKVSTEKISAEDTDSQIKSPSVNHQN